MTVATRVLPVVGMSVKEPEHLSVSQLRTLLMCGYKWAYEHPLGERTTADVGWSARLRGSCLDNAVSAHFRLKAENGVGLSVADMQGLAEKEHRDAEDVTHWDMPHIYSLDRLMKQVALYAKTFGEQFSPRAVDDVQKTITYKHPQLTVPIVGIVDLIASLPIIVDTKIKGKIPKQADVDRDWQLTTYTMMTGVPLVALAIITDEASPRAELICSRRNQAQVDGIMQMYNAAWATIKARAFTPACEGHWLCTSKWCNHWEYCPMGAASTIEDNSIPGMDE